jgi:hypothetical protein
LRDVCWSVSSQPRGDQLGHRRLVVDLRAGTYWSELGRAARLGDPRRAVLRHAGRQAAAVRQPTVGMPTLAANSAVKTTMTSSVPKWKTSGPWDQAISTQVSFLPTRLDQRGDRSRPPPPIRLAARSSAGEWSSAQGRLQARSGRSCCPTQPRNKRHPRWTVPSPWWADATSQSSSPPSGGSRRPRGYACPATWRPYVHTPLRSATTTSVQHHPAQTTWAIAFLRPGEYSGPQQLSASKTCL